MRDGPTEPPYLRRDVRRALSCLTVAAVTLSGCTPVFQSLDPSGRADSPLDAMSTERRGEQVFATYGIPITETTTNYKVESGRFRASEVWNLESLEERVFCGWEDDGSPRVRGRDVELEVALRLSQRRGYTRVAMISSGRILTSTDEEPGASCRLASEFTRELVGAVAGEMPGGGNRWPVAREPWDPTGGGVPRVVTSPSAR